MQRKTTLLIVSALVAALAIGVAAPAVSATPDADAHTNNNTTAQNATDTQAQYIADWMETRMGPDGVESFERQTGTTVDEVAHALAENMGPTNNTWFGPAGGSQYGSGTGNGYQAPYGGYGPMMPHGGYGPMMPGGYGYGPGGWGSNGPGAWGGTGGTTGPGGFGSGGYGPGMGGGMGGGW